MKGARRGPRGGSCHSHIHVAALACAPRASVAQRLCSPTKELVEARWVCSHVPWLLHRQVAQLSCVELCGTAWLIVENGGWGDAGRTEHQGRPCTRGNCAWEQGLDVLAIGSRLPPPLLWATPLGGSNGSGFGGPSSLSPRDGGSQEASVCLPGEGTASKTRLVQYWARLVQHWARLVLGTASVLSIG